MGLLDKLEQVEITADSRLPEDDLMFCETQQQAYDESCRALREIRQQWKKAIQAQRDLLGIGQDGSLPYFGSNYRFGITDLNRELEKFHSRFISELTQHFNEKYSVTISTDAIKEHLIPAEPDPYRCDMDTSKEYHRNLRALALHYEDVVDQMFIQLDGLSFVERAFQELRTKCHKAAYWSISNAGYDRKGDTLRFGGYFCSCDERWGHEEWRLAERMQDIFTAVAHYETNTFGRFPAGFSELLGYSDVSTSQFQFPTCQKLVQLRMFKNGRVDLKFKTASIAKEFAETYLDYSC
jgi:hypothetical protein